MLLPKRRIERHIRKRIPDEELSQEDLNDRLLKKYFHMQLKSDGYLLDSENAIIVIKSKEEDEENGYYEMIHQRLVDGNLVEVNRWYLPSYYFGSIHDISVIKDLGLFKVQNGMGDFGSLYDYKNGKFIVPQGDFSKLDFGRNNEILKQWHGMIGSFSICSDYEEGDICSYTNAITGRKEIHSFSVRKGDYYGILDLDGTIRGNQLFRGDSFAEPEEIIDLNEYDSLDAFKKEVRKECNKKKEERKQRYYQMIAERNDDSNSPYLDSAVANVIKVKSNIPKN